MLQSYQKEGVVKKYQTHTSDTGSPEVQVALLSERINYLTEHFKAHKKDNHSKLGLMKMVSKRRKLLSYLHKQDSNRYKKLIEQLGLRK